MNANKVGSACLIDDLLLCFNGILLHSPFKNDAERSRVEFLRVPYYFTLMTRTSWPGRMALSFFNNERP